MVTREMIRAAVRELGLAAKPVCVHSSLRSFGPVVGGAETAVNALLSEQCTVLVPTFSADAYSVPPPPHLRPARNGTDYSFWAELELKPDQRRAGNFDVASIEIDRDMGAIPAAVLRTPGHVRGDHPRDSFTSVGPLARNLVSGQSATDVFAPLRALAAMGGLVALMGVGFESLTLLHAAEQDAGRHPFVRWANGADGEPMAVYEGGCSEGFPQLEAPLSHLTWSGTVGESYWRVMKAEPVLREAAGLIRGNPSVTHCRRLDCERCDDAVAGGPLL